MDWMSKLPFWLHGNPISTLAIPGSHDSGSYSLDPHGPFAPDQSKSLNNLLSACGCLLRSIVYRWSKTQNLNFSQQLELGVRYFDLRISSGPTPYDFSIVHGFFGADVLECFNAIREFSARNPSEVFILDINHFYDMSHIKHHQLINIVIQTLGSILIPHDQSLELISLSSVWRTQKRVFCFYHDRRAFHYPQYLWASGSISCPWPNVTERPKLINYLDARYCCGPPSPSTFYGTQAILTPRTATVVRHFRWSLEGFTGIKTTRALTNWIDTKERENWFNLVIVDFVDLDGIVEKIIALNYKKAVPKILELYAIGDASDSEDDRPLNGTRKSSTHDLLESELRNPEIRRN